MSGLKRTTGTEFYNSNTMTEPTKKWSIWAKDSISWRAIGDHSTEHIQSLVCTSPACVVITIAVEIQDGELRIVKTQHGSGNKVLAKVILDDEMLDSLVTDDVMETSDEVV